MNMMRKTVVALVSTVALGSAASVATPAAFAEKPAPCSKQTTQVDKANAKLAALIAKFEAHPTKKNHRAEKAQVKRVEHAQARLDKCLAAQAS